MTTPIVVVGAGGFGRETLDVVEAAIAAGADIAVRGVVDDSPSPVNLERLAARGVPHLGGIDDWLRFDDDALHLIGVGSPKVRRKIDERLEGAGRIPATVVHPAAVIGSRAVLGPGSVVCGGVQVSTNVRLGRHVHLNPHATIGHDAVLGDHVSVNPAATISGECRIGSSTLIGAASVVLQGLEVGEQCVVGAAACVTRPVGPASVVRGVPARATHEGGDR